MLFDFSPFESIQGESFFFFQKIERIIHFSYKVDFIISVLYMSILSIKIVLYFLNDFTAIIKQ